MDGSNGLIPQVGRGFQQNGVLDWVQLGRCVTSFSVDVLNRYCGGRVHPYTIVVGQAMCKIFRLAPAGRRNVEQALASMTTVNSIGNALYFGLGAESPIHILAQTEEGCTCFALCAALSECYHEDVAVDILLEIASSFATVPGEYMPSSLEWKALLNICSGTLSKTSFPIRAEHFMNLGSSPPPILCSEPVRIAAALLGIAEMSRKDLHSMTVAGPRDAGWIAAFAEWFFDMSVRIVKGDGTVLYSNRNASDNYQLSIIFDASDEESGRLITSDKTYILENAASLFQSEGRDVPQFLVSGRLRWEEALSRAFGEDFQTLSKNSRRSFGTVLGCAASIFKAISQGDPRVPERFREQWTAHDSKTYGIGFVDSSIQQFPELAPLRKYMETACNYDLETACEKYDNALGLIKSHCRCFECSEDGLNESSESDNRDSSTQHTQEDPPLIGGFMGFLQTRQTYCLLSLSETIISLSLMLAHTNLLDAKLSPKRMGFDLAYAEQQSERSETYSHKDEEFARIGLIGHFLNYELVIPDLNSETRNAASRGEIRIRRILQFFTGVGSSTSKYYGMSACSMDGICAFSDLLVLPSDHLDAVGRLNVMPGRIVFNKKSYFILKDALTAYQADGTSEKIARLRTNFASPRLNVKEAADSLKCMIEFSEDDSFKDEAETTRLPIGPAKLGSMLSEYRGSIGCRGNNCRRFTENANIAQQDDRSFTASLGGRRMTLHSCSSPNETFAMLAATAYWNSSVRVALVDQQCSHCCIRAMLAKEGDEILRKGKLLQNFDAFVIRSSRI